MANTTHVLSDEIYITDNKDLNASRQVMNITNEGFTIGNDGIFGVKQTILENGGLWNDEVTTKKFLCTNAKMDMIQSEHARITSLGLERMIMESNGSSRFIAMDTEGYSIYDRGLNSDNPMSENNRKIHMGFLNRYEAYSPAIRLGYNGVNDSNVVGKTYSLMAHFPPLKNPRKINGSYITYGATVGTGMNNSLDFIQGGESHLLSKGSIKFIVNKNGLIDDKGSYNESASIVEDGILAKSVKTQVFSVSGTKQVFYMYGLTSGSENKALEIGIGANFSGAPSDDTMSLKLGKNTILYDGATLHIKEAGSSYKKVKVKELEAEISSPNRLNTSNIHTADKELTMSVQDTYGKKQAILKLGMSNEYSNKPSGELQTMILGSTYFFDGSSLHIKGSSAYKDVWAKSITPKTVSTYNMRNNKDIEVVADDGTVGIDIEKALVAKDKEIILLEKENKELKEGLLRHEVEIINNMLANIETFELILLMTAQKNMKAEGSKMVEVYATLIVKGVKKLSEVPDIIKPQVIERLQQLGIDTDTLD